MALYPYLFLGQQHIYQLVISCVKLILMAAFQLHCFLYCAELGLHPDSTCGNFVISDSIPSLLFCRCKCSKVTYQH